MFSLSITIRYKLNISKDLLYTLKEDIYIFMFPIPVRGRQHFPVIESFPPT